MNDKVLVTGGTGFVASHLVEHLLHDVFGLSLSPGALDNCLHRVGQAAIAGCTAICTQVATAPVIHSDETGSRIAGGKAWHWVFVTADAVLPPLASAYST